MTGTVKKIGIKFGILFLLATALIVGGCVTTGMPALSSIPLSGTEQTDTAGPDLDEPAADISSLEEDDPLPLTPDLRTGTLENGLTYFVRRNTEPSNRAELWLVVNAGSLQETEEQQGLAHFLEHMLFNGTERFPEQALIDFFESVGMTFGPDINAYTSYDETVYQIRFPTDDHEIVETAFQVLEDWAAYATLSPEEVDAERGVIVEENRLRFENASGRILDQVLPVLFGDSRYARRPPIGDMDVIRSAPAEELRNFYETWYRPDLMAVIAVGDFDAQAYETRIQETFSTLPQRPAETGSGVVPRESYTVPYSEETRYAVVTDPELTNTVVEITHKTPAQEADTLGDYRTLLVESLFQRMLNFRLQEVAREADSPFVAANVQSGRLVRTVETLSASALVQEQEVRSGLEGLLTEIERVRQYGFTQSELERGAQDLLSFYDRINQDRENLDSGSLADELRRHFLQGESVPGVPMEYMLANRLIPEISLQEVNLLADSFVSPEDRVVLVLAPEQAAATAGELLPSEEEVSEIIDAVTGAEVEPYEDVAAAGELIDETLPAVEVNAEQTFESIGVKEIELENGVRVLMKPTDFREEQILVSAISPGGSSLVSDEDYLEASYISSIVAQSGLGNYEYNEIIRMLTGPAVGVQPYINELSEGFQGNVVPRDVELLLQLIYLYATAPRADEAALSSLLDQAGASLRNRQRNPDAVLQDRVTEIRYGDTVRRGVPDLQEFEQFDATRAMEIYRERFADFSDFTFIFVGNFEIEEVEPQIRRYLGNLPSPAPDNRTAETWRDVNPDPPRGVITDTVFAGLGERSISHIHFSGSIDPTPENQLHLQMLDRAFDILITEDLREARSGIYAGSVSADVEERPDQLYNFSIAFGSDPARSQELVDAVFQLIEEFQTGGPSAELLTAVKNQMIRDREEALEQNSFWLSVLEEYAFDPEFDPEEILSFEERVASVSAQDLQEAAQTYLSQEHYIQVTLYPQEFDPAGTEAIGN